ncbi:radical SAM protein [Streptomyces phaeochromogenes]|uniref:radical SAM protein n=1 Tax=Streptomyces phaeochromogenes TaxID=1923 RepID=UPI00386E30EF|nr:radical SAM protein [Streptomyces phaeochromogenes]
MSIPTLAETRPSPATGILSVECELTARCQLQCSHCCTLSGPKASTGTMTHDNWLRVTRSIAGLGIPAIQFISGEPTLYPRLIELIEHSRWHGLTVEVYSNLVHIRGALWETLEQDGVRLATSYYSDVPAQHDEITGVSGSYDRTRANIVEALRRGIPMRAGIVRVLEGQRAEEAEAELRQLGVQQIQVDRARKGKSVGPLERERLQALLRAQGEADAARGELSSFFLERLERLMDVTVMPPTAPTLRLRERLRSGHSAIPPGPSARAAPAPSKTMAAETDSPSCSPTTLQGCGSTRARE